MTLDYKNTYWNGRGKHEELNDELLHLIPSEGKAEGYAEVLRCITNVYHDIYNNGGGNLGIRQDQLDTVKAHLLNQNQTVPIWIDTQYTNPWNLDEFCTCNDWHYGDDEDEDYYDDDCECGVNFALTQTIVDELEIITDSIIIFCYEKYTNPKTPV